MLRRPSARLTRPTSRETFRDPDGVEIRPAQRASITIALMLASVLQALDTTIANVALPHIRGSLSATSEQMGWVLTSYIVAAAIMTPLSGALANRFGRKKLLAASVAGFTITSALCGMSQSLFQIVLFRLLQGLCGASIMPLSQVVFLEINPPHRQGRAAALWGMGVLIGPIMGPLVGGWLTDNYSWRWVFFINVPLGLLALVGILSSIHESRTRRSPFDYLGFASLALGVGALQVMLDRGELLDWFDSPEVCFEALIAGLSLYIFIIQTTTARHPFVSSALFSDWNFLVGCVLMFIVSGVMLASLTLLPLLLQDLMNYPVTQAGIVMAPRGVGAFLTMAIMGRFIGRIDSRVLLGVGFGLVAWSVWQLSELSPQMDDRVIVLSGFIQGTGTGLVWLVLAAVTFTTLAPALRYEGTAFFNLARNIGGSLGIAATQALLARNIQILHARLAEHIDAYVAHRHYGTLYDFASGHGLAVLNAVVTRQASFMAFNNDFRLLFWATLGVMPLALLLRTWGDASRTRPATLVE